MQKNIPECSVQRRHYLTQLQHQSATIAVPQAPSYLNPYTIGFGFLILLLILF